jgi:two-component sensor histidine kinase
LKEIITTIANKGTEGFPLSEQRIIRLVNVTCAITCAVTVLTTISIQVFIGFKLLTLLNGIYSSACFFLPVYLNIKKKHIWSKWVLVFLFNQVMLVLYFTVPYAAASWVVLISLFPLYVALFSHQKTIIGLSAVSFSFICIYIYLQSTPNHAPMILYTNNEIMVKQIIYFFVTVIAVLFLSSFIKSNLIDHKQKLEKTISDKEVLLKEVNHRVKNNMQLVSSIIELQQMNIVNPAAKKILKKASDRINSLALANQTLYQNENYELINIKKYIELLTNNLLHLEKVKVSLNIPDSNEIHIEKGQALGFVINELITNSLKHAWKKNDINNSISLSFDTNEDNFYLLNYSDNGIGFPPGFNINEQESLGCSLISSFATRQLGGEISLFNDNGAITEIRFPKNHGI